MVSGAHFHLTMETEDKAGQRHTVDALWGLQELSCFSLAKPTLGGADVLMELALVSELTRYEVFKKVCAMVSCEGLTTWVLAIRRGQDLLRSLMQS